MRVAKKDKHGRPAAARLFTEACSSFLRKGRTCAGGDPGPWQNSLAFWLMVATEKRQNFSLLLYLRAQRFAGLRVHAASSLR